MALTDATRDRLLSLKVAADALAQYADAASQNANSDSVTDDPLMSSVRRGYLACTAIGSEFLTIDRPNTAGARFTGANVVTQINAVMAAGTVRTNLTESFNATTTYSAAQIRDRMLPAVASDDLTIANLAAIESGLGMTGGALLQQ